MQAHGYSRRRRPRQGQHRPRSARSAKDDRRRGRRQARAEDNAAGKAGASAAPGTVRAQRGDFYENNVGRFISVEANTRRPRSPARTRTGTGCSYTGPVLVAGCYDAAGNRMGGGNLTTYIDPDVNPDYYQYHYQVFRIGNKGDGGPDPASVKIAAPNGDVDTLAAKEWVAKDPPSYAANFKKDFITRYYDGPEVYKKMRDLAAEFPNISQVYRPAGEDHGLPAQGADDARLSGRVLRHLRRRQPARRQHGAPSAANGDRAIVLTSKAWGHEGGNSITAQLVDPRRRTRRCGSRRPATRSRPPRHGAGGEITSTAARSSTRSTPTPPRPRSSPPASTGRAPAPASSCRARSPRSATCCAPRRRCRADRRPRRCCASATTRDGSKVGVFFYCQEHGNEIATSGVCLETAERLVRNYGTDPETTTLRRQPRHVHRPADQRRRLDPLAV